MTKGKKLFVRATGHHENAVMQDVWEFFVTVGKDVSDKQFYEDLTLDIIDKFKERYQHNYQPREISIFALSAI